MEERVKGVKAFHHGRWGKGNSANIPKPVVWGIEAAKQLATVGLQG